MTSAQRELKRPDISNAEFRAAEREGGNAETLFWVFGGGATLTLGAALVLALTNGDATPPSAAGK